VLAIGLTERAGNRHDLALALTMQGHVAWQLGKAKEALTALERCASEARRPDVVSVGAELKCRVMAAQVTIQAGDRDATIAAADAVIARSVERAAELTVRETYELCSALAVVLINAHEEERALGLLKRAVELFEDAEAHHDPAVVVDVYAPGELATERGVALLQLGRGEAAAEELAAAQPKLEGFELLQVQAKLYSAEAERRRGRADRSRALIHEIERSQVLTPRDHAFIENVQGNLALDAGDCAAAEAAVARAAGHATADEAPDELGDRLFVKARLAVARARPDAAAQVAAARTAFERAYNARRIAELAALPGVRCK